MRGSASSSLALAPSASKTAAVVFEVALRIALPS